MFLIKLKLNGLDLVVCLFVAAELHMAAQETKAVPPDKNGYNLFNPTPDEYMREMSPDRPDKTDSPFTVDAGHFQLEMDYANFTYDRDQLIKDIKKLTIGEGQFLDVFDQL